MQVNLNVNLKKMENKLTTEQKEELLNKPTIVNEELIDMDKISEVSRGQQIESS